MKLPFFGLLLSFLVAVAAPSIGQAQILDWPFPPPRSIDTNGDGVISIEELRRFLVELGVAERYVELIANRDLINRIDTNHDGQVSIDEILQYIGYVFETLHLEDCLRLSGDQLRECIRQRIIDHPFEPRGLWRKIFWLYDAIWKYATESGMDILGKIAELWGEYVVDLVEEYGAIAVAEHLYHLCLAQGKTPEVCAEQWRELLNLICQLRPDLCPFPTDDACEGDDMYRAGLVAGGAGAPQCIAPAAPISGGMSSY